MKYKIVSLFFLASIATVSVNAQVKHDAKETEYYTPVPKVVTPVVNHKVQLFY